jgi:hypothetical protein
MQRRTSAASASYAGFSRSVIGKTRRVTPMTQRNAGINLASIRKKLYYHPPCIAWLLESATCKSRVI